MKGIRVGQYELMFPKDFCGTLCARDGIKTGPHSPNGEDAYDRKLVVMKIRRKKSVMCFSSPQDHCVMRGYMIECAPTLNAAAGMSGNNRPFIVSVDKAM